jgi:hypothetical protein
MACATVLRPSTVPELSHFRFGIAETAAMLPTKCLLWPAHIWALCLSVYHTINNQFTNHWQGTQFAWGVRHLQAKLCPLTANLKVILKNHIPPATRSF